MAEVYEHVTTSHLDELATAMTANHPNCASLAERIVVSNLHKNTKKSFSETIKDMYNRFNERSGLKAPWIAADVYKIIMKNVARLDSEIIYDWDDDYDYFGFKTLEGINYHDMLGKRGFQWNQILCQSSLVAEFLRIVFFLFTKLAEVTAIVLSNLNKIIDINYYSVKTAKRSNLCHRPFGIGVQGLADTFILHGMAFDSPEAQQLNKDIFETICHHALKDSGELAVKEGSREIYDGCPVSEYGMMC